MKHPPKQIADLEARALIEKYITEYNAQKSISSPLTLLKTY